EPVARGGRPAARRSVAFGPSSSGTGRCPSLRGIFCKALAVGSHWFGDSLRPCHGRSDPRQDPTTQLSTIHHLEGIRPMRHSFLSLLAVLGVAACGSSEKAAKTST